jgi:hypothetical protein
MFRFVSSHFYSHLYQCLYVYVNVFVKLVVWVAEQAGAVAQLAPLKSPLRIFEKVF